MEISITDVENAPPGCVLSLVPSGAPARQAPLLPRQKFTWRSAGTGQNLKVDVLSVIGSTQLGAEDLCAPAKGCPSYCEVVVPPNGDDGRADPGRNVSMRFGLSINTGPHLSKEYDADFDGSLVDSLSLLAEKTQHASQKTKGGRNYLHQHQVLEFIEQLLYELMVDQPADPWDHFSSRLPRKPLGTLGRDLGMNAKTFDPPLHARPQDSWWGPFSSREPEAEASRPTTAGPTCGRPPSAGMTHAGFGPLAEPEAEASRPSTAGPTRFRERPPTAGPLRRPMSASRGSRPASSSTGRYEPDEEASRPGTADQGLRGFRSVPLRGGRTGSKTNLEEFLRAEALTLGDSHDNEVVFGSSAASAILEEAESYDTTSQHGTRSPPDTTSNSPSNAGEDASMPLCSGGGFEMAGSAARALRKGRSTSRLEPASATERSSGRLSSPAIQAASPPLLTHDPPQANDELSAGSLASIGKVESEVRTLRTEDAPIETQETSADCPVRRLPTSSDVARASLRDVYRSVGLSSTFATSAEAVRGESKGRSRSLSSECDPFASTGALMMLDLPESGFPAPAWDDMEDVGKIALTDKLHLETKPAACAESVPVLATNQCVLPAYDAEDEPMQHQILGQNFHSDGWATPRSARPTFLPTVELHSLVEGWWPSSARDTADSCTMPTPRLWIYESPVKGHDLMPPETIAETGYCAQDSAYMPTPRLNAIPWSPPSLVASADLVKHLIQGSACDRPLGEDDRGSHVASEASPSTSAAQLLLNRVYSRIICRSRWHVSDVAHALGPHDAGAPFDTSSVSAVQTFEQDTGTQALSLSTSFSKSIFGSEFDATAVPESPAHDITQNVSETLGTTMLLVDHDSISMEATEQLGPENQEDTSAKLAPKTPPNIRSMCAQSVMLGVATMLEDRVDLLRKENQEYAENNAALKDELARLDDIEAGTRIEERKSTFDPTTTAFEDALVKANRLHHELLAKNEAAKNEAARLHQQLLRDELWDLHALLGD